MPPQTSTTLIHIMALDGIVNVNSIFTIALFIGLTSTPSDHSYTLLSTPACAATAATAERLVSRHVYSFSSFLFSSLVALGLKQAIRIADHDHILNCHAVLHGAGRVDLRMLRVGILGSALGSVFGCVFLTLALVDWVQIKLGVLACCLLGLLHFGCCYPSCHVSPFCSHHIYFHCVPCLPAIRSYRESGLILRQQQRHADRRQHCAPRLHAIRS
nr:uncharacterized protein LOC109163846 [Ipomoea batatas]